MADTLAVHSRLRSLTISVYMRKVYNLEAQLDSVAKKSSVSYTIRMWIFDDEMVYAWGWIDSGQTGVGVCMTRIDNPLRLLCGQDLEPLFPSAFSFLLSLSVSLLIRLRSRHTYLHVSSSSLNNAGKCCAGSWDSAVLSTLCAWPVLMSRYLLSLAAMKALLSASPNVVCFRVSPLSCPVRPRLRSKLTLDEPGVLSIVSPAALP